VGRAGAPVVLLPAMDDEERERLQNSAAVLKTAIAAITG
jgi:hypothetical protein